MTVSTTTSRADYTGNGATTAFAVPFYFLDSSHITVIRTQISTGVATTLAITTDYTVTGAGVPAGGTVTCVVAPTADQRLSVLRNVPFTQLTTYVPNDPFPATSHERALDLLTMETQQLAEQASRALTVPANTNISSSLPAPSANKVIAWNATANGFQNLDASSLASIVSFANAYSDVFSGTGAQTAFTLSNNPGSLANLRVSISGVMQRPTIDYTWSSGTTLTFTSAPASGTNNILVQYATAAPGPLGIGTIATQDANNVAITGGSISGVTFSGTLSGAQVISANSATDALRITQTGAGNALLVEDSANPDSTPLVVTANGEVGINTLLPVAAVPVTVEANSANAISQVLRGRSDGIAVVLFNDNSNVENGRLDVRNNLFDIRTAKASPITFSINNSERMRIDTNGRAVIGNPAAFTAASATYKTYLLGSSTDYPLLAGYTGNSALGARIALAKSRNADWATFAAVQNGDVLGELAFIGADGTNFVEGARISASVDGSPGTNDMPGRLVFSTTADGASSATERMRIDNAGQVGIGITNPSGNLHVYSASSFRPQVIADHASTTVASAGYFILDRSRGSVSARAAVTSGDTLGTFMFRGHDGTGFQNSAWIVAVTEGTVSAGIVPSSLQFFTTPTGGSSTERLRITSTGDIRIVNDAGPTDVNSIGFRGTPTNTQNAAYTLVLTDAGKTIYHDEVTARTWTIPANSSVAFPIGTTIIIDNTGNAGAAGAITLAITTDTLRRGDGTAGTGSRTIAASAVAMIRKTKATEWVITGTFT